MKEKKTCPFPCMLKALEIKPEKKESIAKMTEPMVEKTRRKAKSGKQWLKDIEKKIKKSQKKG